MSVTGLAGMLNIKGLVPDLLLPDEIYAGIPAPFHISISNTGKLLPSFIVTLECPLASQPVLFPVIPADSVKYGTLQMTFARRGEQSLGRVTINSPYPVGFFIRYWTYEINHIATVFPRPIASSYIDGGGDKPASGISVRPERGHSGDIEKISPYTGSEPLRMVHWKHSARSDELHVKEFSRHLATPVEIDLDKVFGRDLEERISGAAWLVQRWVPERPVGLRMAERAIPAGIGRQHGLKLLNELALYDSH